MSYATSNILSPQRLRKAAGRQNIAPSNPAYALKADSMVGNVGGLVVPAEYFNDTNYADEAAARAAFKLACFGICAVGTKVGEQIPVVCYWEGIVEFDIDDGQFLPGFHHVDLAWDATAGELMGQKWRARTAEPYLGSVDKTTPLGVQQFGVATSSRLAAMIDVERFRNQ